jgi:20S proteasome subunit beta 4
VHFCDLIVANVKFYQLKNGQSLSTHAVAHFTRKQLADSLRSVRSNTVVMPSCAFRWQCICHECSRI